MKQIMPLSNGNDISSDNRSAESALYVDVTSVFEACFGGLYLLQ